MQLWRLNQTSFQMRVFNGQFIGVDKQGQGVDLVAVSKTSGRWETFEIVRKSDDLNRVRIKAPNGFFVQVRLLRLYQSQCKKELFLEIEQGLYKITNR